MKEALPVITEQTDPPPNVHCGGFNPIKFLVAANNWRLRQYGLADRIEMQEQNEFEDWPCEGSC